jgi:serine protease AprX
VLVHLGPGADRRAVRAFAARHGGKVRYEYKLLPNVVNLRGIPRAAVEGWAARMPDLIRVEEDREVRAHLDDSTPLIRALQSQLEGAGLPADGAGVRVCVLDSGIISNHMMYADRVDGDAGWDFVNNDADPEDDYGHGTHVAGIAVGGTGLEVWSDCGYYKPFQGIAPEATLIGVKVLNASGSGTYSDVMAGIEHCADQTSSGGRADVINLSLGAGGFTESCDGDAMAAAANAAVDAGVVVVASSGNDGFSNAMGTPACGSKVIAVGATYDANYPNCSEPTTDRFFFPVCGDYMPHVDDLVCFTNQSDELDVTAPGCKIWSANLSGTGATAKCGTSMSSPHVAGLAALLRSQDGTLSPAEVRQVIRDGAIDLGSGGFDRGYGHGRIDVMNSLTLVTPCFTHGAACGNGVCEAGDGEDCLSCPQDCNGKQTGKPKGRYCCGDGDGENPLPCSDGRCQSGGKACTEESVLGSCCGDTICEGVETVFNCTDDCGPPPICGDAICDPEEDQCSCPEDCGTPPDTELSCTDGLDNDCDGPVDCNDLDCDSDPACSSSCEPLGAPCSSNADCCSGKCKGKPGSKTCK